ncbi:MAG: DUF2269 family protein [Chloroflexi bacterium]|nr:DUF2269 family protein [Chloroflexota bacterium]
MDPITLLKIVHIVAAIVALGSNITYGVWLRHAGLDRDRLVFVIGGIRRLDRLVANPAYVVVLLTGLAMVIWGPFDFGAGWIQVALGLYALVVLIGIGLFAPAIRRQLAAAETDPASEEYRRAARRGTALGVLTIAIVLAIVVLMVAKPF